MLNEDRDAATLSTAAVRFFRDLHGIHEPILLMSGEWSLRGFTPIRVATHKVLIKFNY